MKLITLNNRTYEQLNVETGDFFRAKLKEIKTQALHSYFAEEEMSPENPLPGIAMEYHRRIEDKLRKLEKKIAKSR